MVSTIPVDQNQGPTQLGGKKKGNGHKANCMCPICKNMRNKKHGGGEEVVDAVGDDNKITGGKKKNGHKANCGCPICINMKHAKRSKRNRDNKRGGTKTRKQGGGEEDELDMKTHGTEDDDETKLDETQHGLNKEDENKKKGSRKKKRGNGHKANCMCPICKNMRKNKKGGDIEDQKEEKADDDEYDELDKMEKGPIVVEENRVSTDSVLDKMEKGTDLPNNNSNTDLTSLEEGKTNFNNIGADEKVGGKRRSRKHKSKLNKKRSQKRR